MSKQRKIEELTTDELGKLFPIELVPYKQNWKDIFETEKKLLQTKLGGQIILKIEHFGSTSIEGLAAKPIIDILIEIPVLTNELKERILNLMKGLNYQFIWRTDEQPAYMNFVKGYTLKGYNGNIVHVYMGDKTHPLWERISFRNYLRKNPIIAKEYEKLKWALAAKYKFNREDYTKAKTEFVRRITEIAKNKNEPQ